MDGYINYPTSEEVNSIMEEKIVVEEVDEQPQAVPQFSLSLNAFIGIAINIVIGNVTTLAIIAYLIVKSYKTGEVDMNLVLYSLVSMVASTLIIILSYKMDKWVFYNAENKLD